MKSIETRYAGCNFRSRLEARWAVFFDALNMRWQYEPEGFELSTGRYLPDFWLPETQVWIEIKGVDPSERDQARFLELARETAARGHRSRLLGPVGRQTAEFKGHVGVPCFIASTEYVPLAGPGIETAHVTEDGELAVDPRSYAGVPLENWKLTHSIWVPNRSKAALEGALEAARSARFEYGQSGAT